MITSLLITCCSSYDVSICSELIRELQHFPLTFVSKCPTEQLKRIELCFGSWLKETVSTRAIQTSKNEKIKAAVREHKGLSHAPWESRCRLEI